jgi:MFS family permease
LPRPLWPFEATASWLWYPIHAGASQYIHNPIAPDQLDQQFGGINGLNYYFPIILERNIGLSNLMARILTGCNATSYAISSGLCFWMIDRFGRRSLMMAGSWLQFFAYVMVAIAIALLAKAPSQVSADALCTT